MLVLKTLFNLIIVLLWQLTVCNSIQDAIQHMNLKFNRINRITNGLQRDVEDIWTALSNIVVLKPGKVDQDKNETEPVNPNSEEVLKLVNGTVSEVKELKAEVEEFMVYALSGLKNEKAFSRKILKETQTSQAEHEAKTRNDIEEMKAWQQNLEQNQRQSLEDKFHIFILKTENDDRILLEKAENMTSKCEAKLKENELVTQMLLNDKLEIVKQNFTSIEKYVTDAVSLAKQDIFEKLREAMTCEHPWERFGDNCYFLSSVAMGWDDAWEHCRSKGSHLLEVDNADEINFLVKKYKAHYYVWVGGNDKETEGVFMWQTSKKAIPTNLFYPGEPNNRGGEDCAHLYCNSDNSAKVGKLNDGKCAVKIKFICEKSKNVF